MVGLILVREKAAFFLGVKPSGLDRERRPCQRPRWDIVSGGETRAGENRMKEP